MCVVKWEKRVDLEGLSEIEIIAAFDAFRTMIGRQKRSGQLSEQARSTKARGGQLEEGQTRGQK